jgi:hypothetical protein
VSLVEEEEEEEEKEEEEKEEEEEEEEKEGEESVVRLCESVIFAVSMEACNIAISA